MKKWVFILIFFIAGCQTTAEAQQVEVSPDKSELMKWVQSAEPSKIEVSSEGTVSTLKEALRVAAPQDTILLKEGRYAEYDITIDQPVTILGEENAIIDVEEKGWGLLIEAPDVTVKGVEIHNIKKGFSDDYAAILVEGVNGAVIENVTLRNGFFGIYLANSINSLVRNNTIIGEAERESSSGNGIHLWSSGNARVEDNRVTGHRDGIYFEFVEKSEISGNISEGNLRYGLHFMFSDQCRYENNTFQKNGAGVAVMFTDEVDMINNKFLDNWGGSSYGLLLKEIRDSRVEGNLFEENTVAVYLEASDRIRFTRNNFLANGWAVEMKSNSVNNEFRENNFIENTFEMSASGSQHFNTFEGNYWSQYEGYDLDRDGIGDVPHRPVRLFNVMVNKQPSSVILLRSLLIDLLDAAERLMPVLTPENVVDEQPKMKEL